MWDETHVFQALHLAAGVCRSHAEPLRFAPRACCAAPSAGNGAIGEGEGKGRAGAEGLPATGGNVPHLGGQGSARPTARSDQLHDRDPQQAAKRARGLSCREGQCGRAEDTGTEQAEGRYNEEEAADGKHREDLKALLPGNALLLDS